MISRQIINELFYEFLQKEGKCWFRVVSDSMLPLIEVNEKVLVRKESPECIRSRDIILFRNHDVLVTHRVVRKLRENGRLHFLQRGDHGGSLGIAPGVSVLGKVVAIEKNGRLLRLDRGWGKVVNTILGIHGCVSYHLGARTNSLKARLTNEPGAKRLRPFYGTLRNAFIFLNLMLIRLFAIGIWIRTKRGT